MVLVCRFDWMEKQFTMREGCGRMNRVDASFFNFNIERAFLKNLNNLSIILFDVMLICIFLLIQINPLIYHLYSSYTVFWLSALIFTIGLSSLRR